MKVSDAMVLLAPCLLALALYAGPGSIATRITGHATPTTNGIVVWPNACKVYNIYAFNPTSTNEYLMLFENTFVSTNTPPQTNAAKPRMGPWPLHSALR